MTNTQTDMKAKTVHAQAKAGVVLSPKAFWEAVEEADQGRKRPVDPRGTFTVEPKP